jgi:hypothetical protein
MSFVVAYCTQFAWRCERSGDRRMDDVSRTRALAATICIVLLSTGCQQKALRSERVAGNNTEPKSHVFEINGLPAPNEASQLAAFTDALKKKRVHTLAASRTASGTFYQDIPRYSYYPVKRTGTLLAREPIRLLLHLAGRCASFFIQLPRRIIVRISISRRPTGMRAMLRSPPFSDLFG